MEVEKWKKDVPTNVLAFLSNFTHQTTKTEPDWKTFSAFVILLLIGREIGLPIS
jgi:hypothetical protein